jgi:bifunctional enzyme CysN/CysC
VYKITGNGDDRRIVAGTVEAGSAAAGDEIVFYPSGKKAIVRSFEAFGARSPVESVSAGQAVGFTLSEQIYVSRGEIATLAREPRPSVTTRLRVNLFWLGHNPLVRNKDYIFRLGTARATMRLDEVHRVIDASDLSSSDHGDRVCRHEVAECTLKLNRAIAVDRATEMPPTGRFAIVDDFEIRGGGIVRDALADEHASVREKVLLRNYMWEPSFIPRHRRAVRFSQRPALLLITGSRAVDRKTLAKETEASLFDEGRSVYFLGIGNVLYGVDSDITRDREHRHEHIRRLAEIANLMLDAGTILIVTAMELRQEDLDLIKTSVDSDSIHTVWLGEPVTTDIPCDLLLTGDGSEGVDRIKRLLQDKGVIFRPW